MISKDLEELNMLQTWKQKALNRNEWRNEIFKIAKEKNTEPFLIQCQHPGCVFLAKNKGGLANHVRQTHQAPIHMTCPNCKKQFKKQGLPNHLKTCSRLIPVFVHLLFSGKAQKRKKEVCVCAIIKFHHVLYNKIPNYKTNIQ